MKQLLTIFILFLLAGILPANADTFATQIFTVNTTNTVAITPSGNFSTTILGMSGALSTPLSVNFNIVANEDVNGITLKALVTNSTGGKYSGFYCTDSSVVTSQSAYMVLIDTDDTTDGSSLANCKQSVSTAILNPGAIAYPATVAITNGGTIQYQDNGGNGYFLTTIKSGTTNLSMSLSTTPKVGTYDIASSLDEDDMYMVEVYLDDIPS